MQKQKKSKLIVIGIVILLTGYVINQFFKSNEQKDRIIKHDMMIGVCAKNKASVESNNYEKLKTHEDIKLELQTNETFNKLFKECEKEFKKAPKDFRAKWNYKAKWDGN
ncbi:hypothetical protein [Candidatus Pelagibacter sp. RS40]|uniref:hypothetical protein n=1 Tax=Candidatus Pelagibacter sp. RS40 TaxID=1977865 RepID=UPI000A159459|nr:hypothetical protein [Candidatus Pelagibacter sp. RS40]ARJ48550.1 hypothetical protein B8063_00535 [Candidatus Pelagibacter sp. RS40]